MKSKMTKHIPTIIDTYPKLMIGHNMGVLDNDVVVLMYEERKGVVMHVTRPEVYKRRVGEHYDNWHIENFHDYKGKITIQN